MKTVCDDDDHHHRPKHMMVARVVVTLIGLVDFGLAVDVQSWQGELDLQAGEDAWILKTNHGQCKAP